MADSRQKKVYEILWENWESDSNDKVFALQKVAELKELFTKFYLSERAEYTLTTKEQEDIDRIIYEQAKARGRRSSQ